MGHYEDSFHEIYDQIRVKGVKDDFEKQLSKMSRQTKHKYKSTKRNVGVCLYESYKFKIMNTKVNKVGLENILSYFHLMKI